MYEAYVKTTRYMQGHHAYQFETQQERSQFLTDHAAEVWWYFFPEADEFSSGADSPSWSNPRTGHAGWNRGGAWGARPGPEAPRDSDVDPGDEITPVPAPSPSPKGSRW